MSEQDKFPPDFPTDAAIEPTEATEPTESTNANIVNQPKAEGTMTQTLVKPAAPEKASAAPETSQQVTIQSLLKGLVKHKASDLHVKVGRPPLYRINGKLLPARVPELTLDDVTRLAYATMTQKQIREFEENLQIDFGYLVPGLARFRTNVFMQKSTLAFVIRVVPLEIPSFMTLNLPAVISELALKSRGLLLFTGATGSGKSTSLAAVIEYINCVRGCHIITIEDPIEYIFEDKKSTVSQREVGTDAVDMQQALKGALRQDPDVIVVGEMRDFNTIQTAITAAETGHLVISTLHTNNASQSIDRIIDSFPADSKNQLRLQLANSVLGIVSQRLIKRADGKGRVAACEVMVKSPTVEKLILENRINELDVTIEGSNQYYKMQSMNQALERLVREGTITKTEALLNSDKREDLELKLSGLVGGAHGGVEASELLEQASDVSAEGVIKDGGGLRELPSADDVDNSGIQVEDRAAQLGQMHSSGGKLKIPSGFFKKKGA